MKTGEDTVEVGLYATECCGIELAFDKGNCFCRCPRCQGLCTWELVEPIDEWIDFKGSKAA